MGEVARSCELEEVPLHIHSMFGPCTENILLYKVQIALQELQLCCELDHVPSTAV